VKNTGTQERPVWSWRYVDTDGKRKHRPTKQTTKAAALRVVAEIEARVARGLIGIIELSEDEQNARALTLSARSIAGRAREKTSCRAVTGCAAPGAL